MTKDQRPRAAGPLRAALAGTDTGVGKTHVMRALAAGLRARRRRVWLWKPVACGDWRFGRAGDVRRLQGLLGDGQDPASLCRHQWRDDCAPAWAARRAGERLELATLVDEGRALLAGDHDLLVEGAGGVLSPLTGDDGDLTGLCAALDLAVLLVADPALGAIGRCRAAVLALRQQGCALLGLVLNDRTGQGCPAELLADLERLCAAPVLTVLRPGLRGPCSAAGVELADRVLGAA